MRVAVGMSGGIDSSVAAAILQQRGFDVIGVTMRVIDNDGSVRGSTKTVKDAQMVGAKLKIPHYVLDLQEAFNNEVINEFCREYANGRTPNPCISCNERIKFGIMLQKAFGLGAESFATGHHARLKRDEQGIWHLLKARDKHKDQSYFLYRLNQGQMKQILMPVGEYTKEQVRQLAHDFKLPVAEKSESQEICFVPTGDYAGFLKKRRPELFRPGPVKDIKGNLVGRHPGFANYTIGQRKGLGIAFGKRQYVVCIKPGENLIVVGNENDARSNIAELENIHWISGRASREKFRAVIKIRSQGLGGAASVELPDNKTAVVRFDEPQWAITPGQAAVFYQGDMVLGGGTIKQSLDGMI